MGKRVTFYFGPAVGLTQRELIITRVPDASDGVTMPSATSSQTLGGSVESAAVILSDNIQFQATLQDTKSTGEVGRLFVLPFNTGSLQFPGPAYNDPGASLFRVLAMEDMSSSSSASSVSSSSSESSSSQSSSSSSASSVSSSSSSSPSSSSQSSSSSP